MVEYLKNLFEHLYWADALLQKALPGYSESTSLLLNEFSHTIAAEEIWLARLTAREARCSVWPSYQQLTSSNLVEETHQGYREYLDQLKAEKLEQAVSYVNSAGQSFATKISDILLHVCLHGQYHRGKVNQLLREHDFPPAPVDYIAFVRGVPAARS